MEKHNSVVENKVSRNRFLHKPKNIFSKGSLKTQYFSFVQLLKLWEYCLGKHHSKKTGKTCKQKRQAIRAVYAAEYTRERMEEMKVLNI